MKSTPTPWWHKLDVKRAHQVGTTQYMVETDKGAVLVWTFAMEGDEDWVLATLLSPGEVKRLLSAPAGSGALEAVRGSLTHPEALLAVGKNIDVYFVPSEGDESTFVDDLMDRAELLAAGHVAPRPQLAMAAPLFKMPVGLVPA